MGSKDEKPEAFWAKAHLIDIISELGLEFLELSQSLNLEQALFLKRRLQLARQAASPTFDRCISTHTTKLDYAHQPAKIGNVQGMRAMLQTRFERWRQRKEKKIIGVRIVEIHIVTFAETRLMSDNIGFLRNEGFRMTSLHELLCFVNDHPLLVGSNDILITLEDDAVEKGSKPRIETYAHCIGRNAKGELVYKLQHIRAFLDEQVHSAEDRMKLPLLHFVVMDAEKQPVETDGYVQPPSYS